MEDNKFNVKNSLLSDDLLRLLPDWWRSIDREKYYLVLTDDCDSLFSCERLYTLFGVEIGGFYDFEKGLYLNNDISGYGCKIPIYVDLSIGRDQFCFDNHRTFVPNSNRVNPNIISREYKDKYNFSTLTFIAGLYGGIDQMSEIQKTILLAIDGGYVGYYKNDGKWKDVNVYWLEKLGLAEYLLPILASHNMQYFQDFSVDHSLYDKIFINEDGYLETPIYQVPDYKFKLVQPINKIYTSKQDAIMRYENKEDILISAETYKDNYVLNIAI